MIETKEQYQAYREGRDIVFFPVDGRRIVANSKNEAIETIEALRKVARIADLMINAIAEMAEHARVPDELMSATIAGDKLLNDLPDWLTDA